MKKLRSLLFTLAILTLCLLLLPTEADAAGVWDLTFELNNSGTGYVVTDCNEAASGKLIIPATYKEKPVIGIGSGAFYGCTGLTSVTIGDSVTSIGESAFYDCTSLTSVTIGDSVTYIYEYAFSYCTSLKSVTIPDSVTYIGYYAFRGCTSLTSVTIGDSVESIGRCAFEYCTNLASVTIPDSVKSIGVGAFSDCKSLTSVTIPDSVTSIGTSAFSDCTSLTGIYVADGNSQYCNDNRGVLFNKNKTFLVQAPGAINGTYTVPDSVTSIGDCAFDGCTSLTSVTIPDSVTNIYDYAFSGCTSLKSVTIADSVTSIGSAAFSGCTSLTSVTIPDSVTYIYDGAFSGCTSLKSVTIPDSVTGIGYRAFDICTSLKKVYYGGSQTQWEKITIGDYNGNLYNAEKIYNYKVYNRSATVIKTSGANIWSEPSTSGSSKLVRTAKYNTKLNVAVKYNNWYQLTDGNWVYSTNILPTDYNHADIEGISAESESKTFVVTSWGANIWSKPYSSGNSRVVKSVEKTAALSVIGQVRNSTGGLWYMLEDGGWIYSKNVNERIFDPADVIAYKRSATVIVPGVINIWGQPSTKAPSTLTRTAAYQTKLNVVAQYTTAAGGVWYQLTDGNWVYSTNIRITDYNPADVQKVNKTVTVTSWGANVWSKPYSSGDSKVVKTVAKAANLKIDGQVRNSTYGLWYRLADGSGWIYSQNVKVK